MSSGGNLMRIAGPVVFVVMHLAILLLSIAALVAGWDDQLSGAARVLADAGTYSLWAGILCSWLAIGYERLRSVADEKP